MDKAFILSSIIDEYQKVIDNLKLRWKRYKHESDIDEDNTLRPRRLCQTNRSQRHAASL